MDLAKDLKKLAACSDCYYPDADNPLSPAMGEVYTGNAKMQQNQMGGGMGANMNPKHMVGMNMGHDMPADAGMVEMIKQDPEALAHYQMAVDKVVLNFKNMNVHERMGMVSQGDMAQMFNDPSMSSMGAFQGGFMDQAGGEMMGPMGPEGPMGQGGPMVDEEGNEVMTDEEGNPTEEPEVDEEGNPIEAEEGAEGKEAPEGKESPAEEGEEEEAPAEEGEESMYPFGQREKKEKPEGKKEEESDEKSDEDKEDKEKKKGKNPFAKKAEAKAPQSLLDALKDLLVK